MTKRAMVFVIVMNLALGSAGCAGGPTPKGQKGLFDFIQDGITTKQEVYARLGEPGATYERERVLTYRLGRDTGGDFVFRDKADWNGVCSNLVFALDGSGLLRQHSLVRVGNCP